MSQYKTSGVIMKGDPKPISQHVSKFPEIQINPVISDSKVYERPARLLRQTKEANQENINSTNKSQKQDETIGKQIPFDMDVNEPLGEQEKMNRIKYPFVWIEDKISFRLSYEFKDDYEKINRSDKVLYNFFKNSENVSISSIYIVLEEINKLIDEDYNILSEKINEFLNIFIMIFESYLDSNLSDEECQVGRDKIITSKFRLYHENLLSFFSKCQKNRTEEMNYIFRFLFLEKIFEAINNPQHDEKILYFCEIIYRILDPNESQQVEFIKFIKENLRSLELVYDCLAIFHDLIPNYSESFIDGSLFYAINGLSNESINIRFHSLYILMKYVELNVNFFNNLESKLQFI